MLELTGCRSSAPSRGMAEGPPKSSHRLTPHKLHVRRLSCECYTTLAVRAPPAIRITTAVSHRAPLFDKAGVHDTIRLFQWAIQKGSIRIEPAPHNPDP